MKLSTIIVAGIAMLSGLTQAQADGELRLYNWDDYTSPQLIEKFTAETGIKVTVGSFETNEMMHAIIKAGNHGYDLVVPSDYMVRTLIQEGRLQVIDASQMENYRHLDTQWTKPYFDPGRNYSVPWAWGTTGLTVNTSYYNGPMKTSWGLLFLPPEELRGQVNLLDDRHQVINAGLLYLGLEACTADEDDLQKLRALLLLSSASWRSIKSDVVEDLIIEDVMATQYWSSASLRARLEKPKLIYTRPEEGVVAWMDNVVLLKDAQNVDEAKAFLNFIMAPENAALITNHTRLSNGISGSEAFMDADLATAPEIVGYEGAGKPVLIPTCPKEVSETYAEIWVGVKLQINSRTE